MSLERFHALCANLCELFGAATPDSATQDPKGYTMSIELDGLEVSVLHVESAGDAVVLTAQLGTVQEADEDRAHRAMLEANFLMIGQPFTPSFSRDPATGRFFIHYARPLADWTGSDLYQAVMRMAHVRRKWQGIAAGSP